ncbi:MAG TPA: DNA gyrase inhibitor YacG [Burkholderiaceae bacterium]|jgi:endogenous inhibitor of DNA gyrase (YacG/DUF329 family)|nr:DNA gyrase inhibitor YacG [Burkholderiaceae bacterium]
MTPATAPVRIVRCPRCGGTSVYAAGNPYRPFCSERCKAADFGAWASEAYRVEAAPPREDGGDAGPAQPER